MGNHSVEFWTSTVASPTRSAEYGAEFERLGYDGMLVVDSQNLSGDPYVALAMAATSTTTLGLETSVTNPVTRLAATTASSAMSVQKLSRGRMVLGIGRGDSALAHLGHAPAKVGWFEQYLENLQAYLAGEAVPFERTGITAEMAPPVDTLGLADAPTASSIDWAKGTDKVPVEVAATGPKVIAASARHADRIMFALGADPARVAWGIETAKAAADQAGRSLETLSFGAYVNVVCHEDLGLARQLAQGGTGLFARFSVMHGTVSGPADDAQTEVFHNIHDRYDMHAHGRQGGNQTTALTDEFIDSFAIIGDAAHCVDRLNQLAELGIGKFAVTGPTFMARDPDAQAAGTNFVEQVMPAFGE